MGWGRNIECTFFGSLDVALRFLGESVDYPYLMGVSAAAFRLKFHQPEWCASSPDAALDGTYPEAVMKAIGYKGEFIVRMVPGERAIDRMFQLIKEEIDSRRPMLAIGLTRFPDWGVIAGYDGKKILCRTYYDEGEEYSVAEEFPWIMFRMRKKEEKPPTMEENIINSIRLAVELAYTPFIDRYANGLTAYDVWIKDLENEEMFAKMNQKELFIHWHINGWIYDSLYDARNAAVEYLKKAEKILKGKNKDVVKEAAEKFEKVRENIFENWVYFTMPHWVKQGRTWTPKATIETDKWTPEMRRKGAEALKNIRALEEEAFKILGKIKD
ncbi:MAG TPA: hypothetical protein ENF63_01825 [Candidatus Bathyarchaeota archaeon]|nr:hypothetical protein [Candidatus Bathyarchaeota archaeon]